MQGTSGGASLPKNLDAVLPKAPIMGQHRQSLLGGLRDEKPVKGIIVVQSKTFQPQEMGIPYVQNFNSAFLELVFDVADGRSEDVKFSEFDLDRHLPE